MEDEAVIGLQDLIDSLGELPLALGTKKNIMARSAREGLEIFTDAASKAAPRDDNDDDGFHMADSMMVVISEQTATSVVGKAGPSRKGFYAMFTEFGTVFVKAAHWFFGAWQSVEQKVLQAVADRMGREIEKEMKKRA